MNYSPSPLWQVMPHDINKKLDLCMDKNAASRSSEAPLPVHFRADDIGVPGKQFTRLMDIFSRFKIPLSLAVVPTWLTPARWDVINRSTKGENPLWCWHQHGWRHINNERTGKKQEFGPGRTAEKIKYDLSRGKKKLENLLGKDFYPGFTPPWNRCSADTIETLENLGFKSISRSKGAKPPTHTGFPDFFMNVDLHTRKEQDPVKGWETLMKELQTALSGESCGIMIHHQRMNENAFKFLELMLQKFSIHRRFRPVNLKDLETSYI